MCTENNENMPKRKKHKLIAISVAIGAFFLLWLALIVYVFINYDINPHLILR